MMLESYGDLDYYIVAFVDILGFSEMVQSDCENRTGSLKFFRILKEINERTKKIGGCSITQFSDSVIFALPLNKENYINMIQIISTYQYELFNNCIICRGAIAYGKHYSEDEFMFSQALIEAYQLETLEAKYPRIILSPNLMEYFMLSPNEKSGLIQEIDGYYYVDYFQADSKENIKEKLEKFNVEIVKCNMRIKEKYYWLFDYWEFKFKEKLSFSQTRFLDF